MTSEDGTGGGASGGSSVLKHAGDEKTWVAPAAWGSATLILTVISLTLDPDWAYFGAWATGFMTMYAVIARAIRLERSRQLRAADEALLLEVRRAEKEGATGEDAGSEEPANGEGESKEAAGEKSPSETAASQKPPRGDAADEVPAIEEATGEE